MPQSADAIDRLLHPRSIAIVGASSSSIWTKAILGNLTRRGFPGRLHLVNPNRAVVLGQAAFASVSEIPEPVDHALILTLAHTLPTILRDCIKAGVHSTTVVASGFEENGSTGAALAAEVKLLCTYNSIAMVGPNCFGFSSYNAHTFVTRNRFEGVGDNGNIAMVFQSGALGLDTCNLAYARGVNLSFAISSGNELVTDANDYFEYFLNRNDCRVIGGTLEVIPEPQRFARIATEARRRGKPIVLLKLGKSAQTQNLAIAHTGSVAGSDVVVDTFLRDLGVIRVDTIEELVETAGLLANKGWPQGDRTIFTAFSGGVCGLAADLAEQTNVAFTPLTAGLCTTIADTVGLLPTSVQNPLDLTTEGFAHFSSVAHTLSASGDFDILLHASEEPRTEADAPMFRPMRAVLDDVAAQTGIYTVFFISADHEPSRFGIQERQGTEAYYLHGGVGMKALSHAISYGRPARIDDAKPYVRWTVELPDVRRQLADKTGSLSEQDSKQLLRAYGIDVSREEFADNCDTAIRWAEEIGYPVVLKIASADIPHKSEAGGVIVDLDDAAAVRQAYHQLISNAQSNAPDAHIDGVLVCEMVTGGHEFFVGVTTDPSIGPIVVAGLGGIYIELIKDVVTAVPPISVAAAEALLGQLSSAPILRGARGQGALDVRAFAEALSRVGQLATDHRNILAAVDINPLFVLADGRGVKAADALVVLRPQN